MDQKAAIMIVIEHLGNIPPGTRCSAVFFDTDRLRQEREFYARTYSQNGVRDPALLRSMVGANVPNEPYWLVSLKPAVTSVGEEPQLYRVDDKTKKVLTT
ncbi:MAG: hypothetical protein Aurels2KO_38770 [Aureliella sp.]